MGQGVVIYCFTGTGNAARIAGSVAAGFRHAGFSAALVPMESGRIPPSHASAAIVGIVAPVLGFGLPHVVARFLRRLPRGRGQKAFALIAMGNKERIGGARGGVSIPPTEGIALLHALLRLLLKGYAIAGASALEMPTNWIMAVNPPDEERAAGMALRADEAARVFAAGMAGGGRRIPAGRLSLAALLAPFFAPVFLLFSLFGRRIGGKWFTSSHQCTGCGQCADMCPQGTIEIHEGKPYWKWNCQQCYRCINLCPAQAIEVSSPIVLATLLPWCLAPFLPRILAPFAFGHGRAASLLCCAVLSLGAGWAGHALGAYRPPLLPPLYLTRNRKRYRETSFDPDSFRR